MREKENCQSIKNAVLTIFVKMILNFDCKNNIAIIKL